MYKKILFCDRKLNKKNVILFTKILILGYISFYLISDFLPYYDGWDSYLYGLVAIRLNESSYELTNEYIKNTDHWEFVPIGHTKTIDDSVIVSSMPGFNYIAAISYAVGGIYGLFYLGPFITILFLITTERISTKLFGTHVGLLTLIFVSSNYLILYHGIQLATESIFSLLFILGLYFFVKFFKENKSKFILLASVFLAASTLMRLNGIIFFPIELILIFSFLLIKKINVGEPQFQHSQINSKTFAISKISLLCMITPWIVFFLIFLSFNAYYFGDPITTYASSIPDDLKFGDTDNYSSFFEINERRLNFVKGYAELMLPYPLSAIPSFSEKYENTFGENWLGILTILILVFVLIVAFKNNKKRIEIVVLSSFIFSFLFFYSASVIAIFPHQTARYIIPAMPIFYILISFLIINFFQFKPKFKTKISSKLIKIFLFCIVVVFFSTAFYLSPSSVIFKENFQIKNPTLLESEHITNTKKLQPDSIVVSTISMHTLDRGAISFYPFLGYPLLDEFDSSKVPQSSIKLLRELIDSGEDVYIYKEPHFRFDKPYYEYLVEKHGFVLIEHSKSFCKLEISSNMEILESKNNCI